VTRKLAERYFYRGLKVEKKGKASSEEQEEKSVRQRKGEKKEEDKEKERKGKKKEKEEVKEKKGKKNEEPESDTLKAKKKYTLEVHEEQMFIDGNDLYVWAYSPTKPWYYITGIIIGK
jgi:translocation protein SEC62